MNISMMKDEQIKNIPFGTRVTTGNDTYGIFLGVNSKGVQVIAYEDKLTEEYLTGLIEYSKK